MKYVKLSEDRTRVENVILWDGAADVVGKERCVLVPANAFVGPGFLHADGVFTPPAEPAQEE